MPELFACPQCRSELERDNAEFRCSSCNKGYPVNEGIPDFSTGSHYWNHLNSEQMAVLLEIAKSHGYRYAIEKILGAFKDKYLIGYALDSNRADFRAILPLGPDTRVLDLGSGWGAVSCSLAPSCASVTSADTNPNTLQFIKIRASQSGLNNVEPVLIESLDKARLPFPDSSFDVVLMNGVLEYVGLSETQLTPREVQKRCLEEVRRVLKPNGALYLGIENRYGYLYFLGSRDHNGLKYTSLLPRFLANLVTQIRSRKPYRTYTYSAGGYRKLLASAGFNKPDMFLGFPTYREPRFIVPAGENRAILYFIRRHLPYLHRKLKTRLLESLLLRLPARVSCGFVRLVAYSFLITAQPQK